MSFRTIVITRQSKCSYKNGYLIVRDDEVKMIHLSEIYCLVFETTAASITAYLVNELIKMKVPVIFCDEQHNPCAEVLSLYGSHNTSKRVAAQAAWDDLCKGSVWTCIIREKILQQAVLLEELGHQKASFLYSYAENMEYNDASNREGHAAKVYFNALFGMEFTRRDESDVNAALNYGYALLLSAFNREVVANGYVTQIGVCHRNEFNNFNLSCDLMEPFRPIVDKFVHSKKAFFFDEEIRFGLIDLLNSKVMYNGSEFYLATAIGMYTKRILAGLSDGKVDNLLFCKMI